MYTVYYTNKFDKDVKRCVKRGLNIAKLQEATRILAAEGLCQYNIVPINYPEIMPGVGNAILNRIG